MFRMRNASHITELLSASENARHYNIIYTMYVKTIVRGRFLLEPLILEQKCPFLNSILLYESHIDVIQNYAENEKNLNRQESLMEAVGAIIYAKEEHYVERILRDRLRDFLHVQVEYGSIFQYTSFDVIVLSHERSIPVDPQVP